MSAEENQPGARQEPSRRFRRTRQDHREETAEDYVEAIDDLIARRGRARVGELAAMLGVSHVTVSRIVSRLCEQGLASTAPYQPIELTGKGLAMAERVRRRHAVVVAFLQAIGVPQGHAEVDAEGIEHHVSPRTLQAMDQFLSDRGLIP